MIQNILCTMKFICIRRLYILDWFIELQRNIINALLQIACFQELLNVTYMEYFMNSSMFF